MVLTGAMMLEWLRETAAARRIRDVVHAALAEGAITIHLDETVAESTRAAGRAVTARLRG